MDKWIFGEGDEERIVQALGINPESIRPIDQAIQRRGRLTKEPMFEQISKGMNQCGRKFLSTTEFLPIPRPRKLFQRICFT